VYVEIQEEGADDAEERPDVDRALQSLNDTG